MRAGSLYSSILGVLAWACVSAGAARAQAPSALSWVREDGAEACIGAPELGARVERLVGPVLVAAPSAEVSVEGHIARQGQRFVAKIVISDARGAVLGQREILSARAAAGAQPDCRALDDQLAFIIAVAIDPNVALAELPGELAPEDPGADLLEELKARPPVPATPRTAPTPPAPAGRSELERGEPERLHLLAAAGPALGVGALPKAAFGMHAELGTALGRFALRGHLRLLLEQQESTDAVTTELSSLALGASLCVAPVRGQVSFELCGGVQSARLAARALDFPGEPRSAWLLGPRLELRATLALTKWLALALGAALVAHRPQHQVTYKAARVEHEIFQVPAVSAELQLLFEARYWSF